MRNFLSGDPDFMIDLSFGMQKLIFGFNLYSQKALGATMSTEFDLFPKDTIKRF